MRIDSLKLNNFRNYDTLEIALDPGTNLFYGDNAQGKTNILEAVYLAGTTKSHRMSRDREMIRFDQDEAHIRMNVVKRDSEYRIDMHLKKDGKKGIAVNGVPIKRAGELVGICRFVFFSPEDLNIIKNGPSERRRFIDMELCQTDSSYIYDLARYNKILAQRNQLLKDIAFRPAMKDTLDIWDEQLLTYGSKIIKARRLFTASLNEIIKGVHEKLSGGREQLSVEYENNVDEDRFIDELVAARDKDLRMRTTSVGPHRDDLKFVTQDIDIRKYGSQGQQRTTALSLKLAEIELVRKMGNDTPILLLDDVLSELDSGRQKYLLESIEQVQTLITCTGVDDFVKNNFRIDRLFRVSAGTAWEDLNG